MSAFANVARVFYAACCRMVFGLSSSEPRKGSGFTSDHLPSADSLAQSRKQERIWQPERLPDNSKLSRNRHEENRNHLHFYDQFAEHRAEISERTSPTGAASVNHSFAGDEFTADGANDRADK